MLIDLLRDLVSIDSVNPDLVPGARGEADAAAHCAAWLRRAGFDVEIQEAAPGRPNVVGVLEGSNPGRALMLCGHLDTVGVEGMASPFSPDVRDGRLYGRGAEDMKGGVAAMMEAGRLARERWTSGRLIIACVCDEEFESIGAQALVQHWTADAAVVTEPTGLSVAVTHKGFAWIALETRGRAAHGSRPAEGRDAILRMGRVLAGLEALEADLSRRDADPLTGPPSVHASVIDGGREWSSYPDRCSLKVERRTVEGESGATALGEVEDILAALRSADPEFEGEARLVAARAPYSLSPAHELPVLLSSLARARGGPGTISGMSFWTDAAILGEAGMPSVLFGPGGGGLHGIEEYVTLADVEDCALVLRDLALKYCEQ